MPLGRVIIGAAVLLAGAASAAVFAAGRSGGTTSPTGQVAGNDHAAITAELQALRREVQSLRADQAALRRVPAAKDVEATAPAEAAERKPQRSVAEQREAQEERELDYMATLDAQVVGEARDADWGRPLEARIHDLVAAERGSHAVSAACQTTLCRVEVEHDTPDAQDAFVQRLMRSPVVQGGSFVKPMNDGEHGPFRSLVYVARGRAALRR